MIDRFVRWRLLVWTKRVRQYYQLTRAQRELDRLCIRVTGRPYHVDPFCERYERLRFQRAVTKRFWWRQFQKPL